MEVQRELNHLELYRLPWTDSDNVLSWLEPTAACNLACDGCYRANVKEHKSLEEIDADLDVFAKYRNFDSVSIAGGDPLTHPQVVDIVRLVAKRGWKPTLNTNGLALNEELLRDLKKAGLKSVTFHIDSRQNRPGWHNKTEVETCELRLQYAEMLARVGNLYCAFNSTVFGDTLHEVPALVAWAQEHIDIVHSMIFISYREAVLNETFDYFVNGKQINPENLVYTTDTKKERVDITTPEIVAKIRERFPDFEPCAYLGGTEQPDSFKWLLSTRFGTKKRIHGHMGPKMMEYIQTLQHAFRGRFVAYPPVKTMKQGKRMLWLFPFDKGVRGAAASALKDLSLLFKPLYAQTIAFIQPIDVLPDGRQNMCDGCPDVTVHNGEIVWSCRLEECLNYGQFVTIAPKDDQATDVQMPPPPHDGANKQPPEQHVA